MGSASLRGAQTSGLESMAAMGEAYRRPRPSDQKRPRNLQGPVKLRATVAEVGSRSGAAIVNDDIGRAPTPTR